jgi:hypothetical protein
MNRRLRHALLAMLWVSCGSSSVSAQGTDSINSFTIAVPEASLTDLRERLARTRWPD